MIVWRWVAYFNIFKIRIRPVLATHDHMIRSQNAIQSRTVQRVLCFASSFPVPIIQNSAEGKLFELHSTTLLVLSLIILCRVLHHHFDGTNQKSTKVQSWVETPISGKWHLQEGSPPEAAVVSFSVQVVVVLVVCWLLVAAILRR